MAKTTKYITRKVLTNHNGETVNIGEIVSGFTKTQEERLIKIGAIEKVEKADDDKKDDNQNDGQADDNQNDGE